MKKIKSLLLIASVITLGLCAQAQTSNNTPVNPITGTAGAPPTPTTLEQDFENWFSLHNTNNQYFVFTNEAELSLATAYNSAHGQIEQELSFGYIHQSEPNAIGFGADATMDSLGVGGQQVSLLAAHPKARFSWDNLAGEIGVGGIRDLKLSGWGGEAEFGFKYRFSKNAGFSIGFDPGWVNKGGPKNHGQMFERLTAALTFAIGK